VHGSTVSIITIDLLVECKKSQMDIGGILGKIPEDRTVLHVRAINVVEADRSKPQIRLALPNED
jgi:hypothetical protein